MLNRDEFPQDVKQRAKRILSSFNNYAIGSYTDITGIEVAKYDIAKYITHRDGVTPCNPQNICIFAGAVDAIDVLLSTNWIYCGSNKHFYSGLN